MAQQTAVDSIISQLKKQKEILKSHFEAGKWNDDRISEIDNCILICENTKPIEKEQIMNAWIVTENELQRMAAEQYYNETYATK